MPSRHALAVLVLNLYDDHHMLGSARPTMTSVITAQEA